MSIHQGPHFPIVYSIRSSLQTYKYLCLLLWFMFICNSFCSSTFNLFTLPIFGFIFYTTGSYIDLRELNYMISSAGEIED